jgi:hypothetical protein
MCCKPLRIYNKRPFCLIDALTGKVNCYHRLSQLRVLGLRHLHRRPVLGIVARELSWRKAEIGLRVRRWLPFVH